MIRSMMKSLIAAGIVLLPASGAALAAGGKPAPLREQDWHFASVFGTYDAVAM